MRTFHGTPVIDSETVATFAPSLRRTTLDEYHRMIAAGILAEDDHVELLEGLILTMSPQKPAHAAVIERLTDAQFTGLPAEFRIRVQLPLTLAESEPEPDIAVVPRSQAGASSHPRHAALVIEVAGESITRDRLVKRLIYARAGIPEYVIADVSARRLEIFRDPRPETGDYAAVEALSEAARFESKTVPDFAFTVADLFHDIS
jgi:Uma2 family endonuclease